MSALKRSARRRKERYYDSYDEEDDLDVSVSRPRRRAAASDVVTPDDMKACLDILNELMDNPEAPPFNQPVDWEAMGLPDYPAVIKYPMDLGTVRDLLTENQLADPDHFAENVRLTFKNAMTYNIPGSYIYTSAEALLELFERKFASWQRARDKGLASPEVVTTRSRKSNVNSSGPIDEDAQLREMKEVIEQTKEAIEYLQRTLEMVQSTHTAILQQHNIEQKPKMRRIKLSQPPKPLTYQEKENLVKQITHLPPEQLPGLLDIISAYSAQEGDDQGEVEIDIERLDDRTLRAVQAYVNECYKNMPELQQAVDEADAAANGEPKVEAMDISQT